MGCDIHLYVEKYGQHGWERCEAEPRVWFVQKDGTPYMTTSWYDGRNYSLFAMLADVRNGYGFAGVDIGDKVRPIDSPRGLPEDVSPEVLRESDEWGVDGHSHTHFTLRELLSVDWDGNTITQRGWVGPSEYLTFLTKGAPETWSGGISGGGVQHISNAQMDAGIVDGTIPVDGGGPFGSGLHFTQVQWTQPWREVAGEDWFQVLEKMRALTLDDGSDVRIVCWFDN